MNKLLKEKILNANILSIISTMNVLNKRLGINIEKLEKLRSANLRGDKK